MEHRGNPVSSGVAVGEVYVYAPRIPSVEERTIPAEEAERAVARYLELREQAKAELAAVREKLGDTDPDKASIFAAHVDMLFDEDMNAEILDRIGREHLSPEWAIQKTYDDYIRLLSRAKDALIRERAADLRDVRRRLHRIWFGLPEQNLSALDKPVVVAAHDLLPSDTATLDRANVLAIVTETGGSTSHSAIIARSYGIPAILGIPGVMERLQDGETVIVDAVDGCLHTQTDEAQRKLYAQKREAHLAHTAELERYRDVPPVTRDGVRIGVHLNIGSASPEELAGSQYVDGVGLFRTEFLYMSAAALPTEQEQFAQYRSAAMEFAERPLILRTLDIGGDKQLAGMEPPDEDNPCLGLRGLRLCLEQRELFKTQLRAALRASCYGNLWIMLPMVTSLDDIRAAKAIIDETKRELDAAGIPYNPGVKVGVMIEVPAIALIADLAAQEVEFASIGTNDLCQYLTAADRLNPAVSRYYQTCHPAMFRVIGQVAAAFRAAGKPIGVCGEMGGDPLAAAVLIGMGLRSLSMNITAIPRIKKLIAGLTIPRAEALAKTVMALSTADEVERRLRHELADLV